MAQAYDLVVIGSGTAAQVASHRMATAGWKVAVIDHRPFGGTCALRGCDPKKMLLTGALVMDDIMRMSGRGPIASDARIVWRDLMRFKRTFTGPIPDKQARRYQKSGIDAFHAAARFTGPNTVELDDGTALRARHVLMSTLSLFDGTVSRLFEVVPESGSGVFLECMGTGTRNRPSGSI